LDKPDISKVPKFVLANKTYRAVVGESGDPVTPLTDKNSKEAGIEQSTIIGSKTPGGKHKPMIDLDFGVEVVNSSTPGHNHLYIDKDLTEDQYIKLLTTMVEVGLVQPNVLEALKKRGQTHLRLPGVKKGGAFENKVKEEFELGGISKTFEATNVSGNITWNVSGAGANWSDASLTAKVVADKDELKKKIDNLQVDFKDQVSKINAQMDYLQFQVNMATTTMNKLADEMKVVQKDLKSLGDGGVDSPPVQW